MRYCSGPSPLGTETLLLVEWWGGPLGTWPSPREGDRAGGAGEQGPGVEHAQSAGNDQAAASGTGEKVCLFLLR